MQELQAFAGVASHWNPGAAHAVCCDLSEDPSLLEYQQRLVLDSSQCCFHQFKPTVPTSRVVKHLYQMGNKTSNTFLL